MFAKTYERINDNIKAKIEYEKFLSLSGKMLTQVLLR
jgi:hypothetical protein